MWENWDGNDSEFCRKYFGSLGRPDFETLDDGLKSLNFTGGTDPNWHYYYCDSLSWTKVAWEYEHWVPRVTSMVFFVSIRLFHCILVFLGGLICSAVAAVLFAVGTFLVFGGFYLVTLGLICKGDANPVLIAAIWLPAVVAGNFSTFAFISVVYAVLIVGSYFAMAFGIIVGAIVFLLVFVASILLIPIISPFLVFVYAYLTGKPILIAGASVCIAAIAIYLFINLPCGKDRRRS